MLDIKFIREHKDLIQAGAKKKHISFSVDELLKKDDERRVVLEKVEKLRARQGEAGKKIAQETNATLKIPMLEEMKVLKEELQREEATLASIMKEWQALMVRVPNIPDVSVPEGDSDEKNAEIRAWGTVPEFSYRAKTQLELMSSLDLSDTDRGTKVAGFRGYFLKNDAALLSFALWQFTLDRLVKKGFTPLIVPSMVRREPFMGTGYLPQGEEDLYKTQDEDYLAGTAEVATMGYFMDEVLEKKDLPKKFVAFSPCFRREAGSHGKDTKGLIRVHEFYKVEQVVLCEASHETSVRHHEELTANAEELLQELNVPYRVVVNCGGDLGLGQVKKYDIECWVPSEGKYRETHSSSYFHDFQTRRLNIRYRDDEGKLKFVHSLNNTALATPRFLIPLIENYQQEDGSVVVPEVLRPYLGGRDRIELRS